jgi:hypothetical protein
MARKLATLDDKSAQDSTEKELDEALEDTFPASDPLPISPTTAVGKPQEDDKKQPPGKKKG